MAKVRLINIIDLEPSSEGKILSSAVIELDDEVQKVEEEKSEGVEIQNQQEPTQKDLRFDRAKGSVIGALWGDAAGAVLEFWQFVITDSRGK